MNKCISILPHPDLKALATKDLICCLFLVWLTVPMLPGITRDALRNELRRRELEA
jgi:hypothetical protein